MNSAIKTLIYILMLLAASHSFAGVMETLMMPGKLNQQHEKYENKCENCHEVFSKKKQTRLCRQCHEEVDKDIKASKGFHGRIANINNIECNACHTDHKGRDSDIVKMDKQTFDHHKTDFALKGKHQHIACDSCHQQNKYRDTSSKCYSCHKVSDIHRGRLGEKCQQCHSSESWLKAKFDHDKTDFKLKGKHNKTNCNNCHINQEYKNTPTQCHQCHITRDVHNGIFGKKCGDCHSSKQWDISVFNHDTQTDYKLSGKHRHIQCEACHRSNPYIHKTPNQCIKCHKDEDVHRGVYGQQCHTCHSNKNWQSIEFDHNRDTDFKLNNKHKITRCDSCHQSKSNKSKSVRSCYACHKANDIHQGSQGKSCDNCHNDKSWSDKVAFDHDLSNFPLTGLHASVACENCHIDTHYSKTPKTCNQCHQQDDVHKGMFSKHCNDCHNPNAWSRWQFDHNTQTDYRLEQSHENLECHACHLVDKKMTKPDSSCNSCHANDDKHNGSFGTQCERCHTQESFSVIQMSGY